MWKRAEPPTDRRSGPRAPCRARASAAAWLLATAALAGPAAAQRAGDRGAAQAQALVGLVNAHRAAPPPCAGQPVKPAAPLAPDAVLAAARPAAGVPLQDTLRDAGYAASRSMAITLSGPGDAAAALQLLRERYCAALSSPMYAEIGIARDGRDWRIVMAQPVLSAGLGDWPAAGRRVLELVNAARAAPRTCGRQRFNAAPPLRWRDELASASLAHSRDMARRNAFAHEGEGGTQVGDRARAQGYGWRAIGENIAAGQGSPEQVMASWLSSPGHCANIMNEGFSEMGAAYAVDRASDATIYWTQVFGTPR